MIGKLLLIFVVCLGSAGLYLHNYGLLPTFINHIQTTVTQFYQNNVLALPIISGLCSALAGLLVKKATSNTTKSLQSNLDIANLANTESQNQITSLQNELNAYKTQFGGDVVGKVQDLSTKLQTAEHTLEVKQREVDTLNKTITGVEAERNDLQDKITKLEYDLAVAKGIIKPPIE